MFVIGVRKLRKTPMRIEDVESRKRKPADVWQAIADLTGAKPLEEIEALAGFDRWQICRNGLPSDYARPLRSDDKTFTGHRPTAHTDAVPERGSEENTPELPSLNRQSYAI